MKKVLPASIFRQSAYKIVGKMNDRLYWWQSIWKWWRLILIDLIDEGLINAVLR